MDLIYPRSGALAGQPNLMVALKTYPGRSLWFTARVAGCERRLGRQGSRDHRAEPCEEATPLRRSAQSHSQPMEFDGLVCMVPGYWSVRTRPGVPGSGPPEHRPEAAPGISARAVRGRGTSNLAGYVATPAAFLTGPLGCVENFSVLHPVVLICAWPAPPKMDMRRPSGRRTGSQPEGVW